MKGKSPAIDNPPAESAEWRLFQSECSSVRFPIDPLYAIPLPLINAIVNLLPEFWNEEEIVYERSLAKHGGGGFSRCQPIGSSPLRTYVLRDDFGGGHSDERKFLGGFPIDRLARDAQVTYDVRFAKDNTARLDKMWRLTDTKMSKLEPAIEASDAFRSKQNEHKVAYAGWLVSNKSFLGDVAALRKTSPPAFRRNGPFPLARERGESCNRTDHAPQLVGR